MSDAFIVETHDHDAASGWRIDTLGTLIDQAQDAAGPNATPQDIDAAFARLAVVYIVRPLTAPTVRAHFVKLWPAIGPMAARSPASFDFIIAEFAERLSDLG